VVELVGTRYYRTFLVFLFFDDFAGSQVFPSFVTHERVVSKQSALARLKEKRAEKRAQSGAIA